MGLDIYLYKYENKERTGSLEDQYEKQSEVIWGDKKYEDMTDAEKDGARTRCKEFALSLGLDEDGNDPAKQKIEIDSAKYPDHYFKVGYFRSSYNDGGLNRVLGNMVGEDLYSIFGRGNNDDYSFQPKWETVKLNALNTIKKFDEFVETNDGSYRVSEFGYNEFSGSPNSFPVDNERKALDVFLDELKKDKKRTHDDSRWYENIHGSFFFGKPKEVVAIISGVKKRIFVDEKLPCSYVVWKDDVSWYRWALEIVVETCDYVLSQPDQDKYYLHWSS